MQADHRQSEKAKRQMSALWLLQLSSEDAASKEEMSDEIPQKVCSDCNEKLSIWDFYESNQTIDGRQSYCKECQKRRNTENQTKRRAALRERGLPSSYDGLESLRERKRDALLSEREQQATDCLNEPESRPEGFLDFIETNSSAFGLSSYSRMFLRVGSLNL